MNEEEYREAHIKELKELNTNMNWVIAALAFIGTAILIIG